MSRRRKNSPPFVMLERSVLNSLEWQSLTHSEMIAYIFLKKNYNGSNNGEISLKYTELKKVFSSATLSKALKGLIKKGWIEKTKYGGLYRYYCLYKLTGAFDKIRI